MDQSDDAPMRAFLLTIGHYLLAASKQKHGLTALNPLFDT
jgi:hypothetical protein